MRKLFDSTQYVEIGKDVKPNEEYLQLNILNMWDFTDAKKFYSNRFTYYITICQRANNTNPYTAKKATENDLTLSEVEKINNYVLTDNVIIKT